MDDNIKLRLNVLELAENLLDMQKSLRTQQNMLFDAAKEIGALRQEVEDLKKEGSPK